MEITNIGCFGIGSPLIGQIWAPSFSRIKAWCFVIYNELRLQLGPTERPEASSDPRVDRVFELECNQWFRRIRIPLTRREIETVGAQLSMEALDMISPELRVYPNPSDENCARCLFQSPCMALMEGENPNTIFEQSLWKKAGSPDQGRLGGASWSVGRGSAPPRWCP
jgi:hypothetical protein